MTDMDDVLRATGRGLRTERQDEDAAVKAYGLGERDQDEKDERVLAEMLGPGSHFVHEVPVLMALCRKVKRLEERLRELEQ